jgi:predicted secreted acid phosphatase
MVIYNSMVNIFNKELLRYNNKSYRPCVVFDIDGTILVDGIYAPKSDDEIIGDVYNFLLYLQEKGIKIFIITARPESNTNRRGTIDMLVDLDIDYVYLYMWDRSAIGSHTEYKTAARKDIHDNRYNIVMSLGDNEWDYGKYGGLGVHIHNDGEYITYH